MNTPVIYSYKGSEISFMSGESTMINATQMAKPFDKRPIDYLRLPSTNELINAIVRKSHIAENQLVITERGGLNPGTWFHEDIALDFAQWLSVDFKLWCNDRIKELLKTGLATVNNDDEAIAYAMQVLNRRLEESRTEKERLEQQNYYLTNEIKESAPKIKCYNDYISSDSTYTTTQIAKEYGWGAETLNKKLADMGVQYKQNGQWILYAKYDNKGYTVSKPVTFPKNDGTTGTQMQTRWTSKGREFIHSLFTES